MGAREQDSLNATTPICKTPSEAPASYTYPVSLVMGRKGRVYEKKTRNGLKAWMSKRVLRSLGLSLQENGACSLQGPYKEAFSHHFFPARAEQEP